MSHSKIGDVLRAQGNLPDALDAFKASLAIRERLIKADPGNGGWQRDLAIGHGRVAMILARQEADSDARAAFTKGRDIIVNLQKKCPTTRHCQDLAWFEDQIAGLKNEKFSTDVRSSASCWG